jgi:GNAT superfamily N-acetyltransferase
MYFNYRKVSIDESKKVFDMLKQAADWINLISVDYWQNWHHPTREHINWILNGLKENQFYFALDKNEIVGMFRLLFNDELFWGKRNDLAGYIHSFTTIRKYKGQGIGKIILNDIEKMLIDKGINLLRLDCSSNVKGLCNYYEKYGFKNSGTIQLFGDELNLYEKRIKM